jgi:hypothetical protein
VASVPALIPAPHNPLDRKGIALMNKLTRIALALASLAALALAVGASWRPN